MEIGAGAEPPRNSINELTGASFAQTVQRINLKLRPVEYEAVRPKRLLRWYHLIPLAILLMLLAWCIRFAIAHWHDVKAWDI
jgi:hypothetical protein